MEVQLCVGLAIIPMKYNDMTVEEVANMCGITDDTVLTVVRGRGITKLDCYLLFNVPGGRGPPLLS